MRTVLYCTLLCVAVQDSAENHGSNVGDGVVGASNSASAADIDVRAVTIQRCIVFVVVSIVCGGDCAAVI